MFKKIFKLGTALEIVNAYLEIKNAIQENSDVWEKIKVEIEKIIDALNAIKDLLPPLKVAIDKIIEAIKGLKNKK